MPIDVVPDDLKSHLLSDDLEGKLKEYLQKFPKAPGIILVSDLDELASGLQEASIRGPLPNIPLFVGPLNNVHRFNTLSAVHHLVSCLSNTISYPPGTIFVVTVDPHVGKNGTDGKKNTEDKRAIIRYEDGTILIGPARAYMRSGEQHGRGAIQQAVEIDREKLIQMGFTNHKGGDVFDGASLFGPVAAGIAFQQHVNGNRSHVDLSIFGEAFDPETIPALEIPRGTITDIETSKGPDDYHNVRLEVACDEFQEGEMIAIREFSTGKLLGVAKRSKGFDGQEGDWVAPTGSKPLMTDEPQYFGPDLVTERPRVVRPGLYLAAVRTPLGPLLSRRLGRPVSVGDQLILTQATAEDIKLAEAMKKLDTLQNHGEELVALIIAGIKERGAEALVRAADVADLVRFIADKTRVCLKR